MHSMKSLADVCEPRKSVFDLQRRDVVLDITDLIDAEIDPTKFFEENFLTDGMKRAAAPSVSTGCLASAEIVNTDGNREEMKRFFSAKSKNGVIHNVLICSRM
jgi:hypothetical protein